MLTHYEPMLAKLICWGETRDEARKRLLAALEMVRIEGVKCNVSLLKAVVSHPDFVNGDYHTGSLPGIVSSNGHNGHHANGNGRNDKELAAAIGVSLLLAVAADSGPGISVRGEGASSWKHYGRREQLFSRTLGSRGWR